MSGHSSEVESFTHNGRKVTIYYDTDAESPRTYGNLATLACWHRRMNLGDEQIAGMPEDELREKVTENGEEIVALLPLHVFEHGGITMSTGAFGDRWDSGQVGWAYITKTNAEKQGCVGTYKAGGDKRGREGETVTWDTARYCEAIKAEVETYAMFLRGEIYGYEVEGANGDHLDSCWGFYGLDDVRQEAKQAAESCDDPADDRAAEELAARATFAGGAS